MSINEIARIILKEMSDVWGGCASPPDADYCDDTRCTCTELAWRIATKIHEAGQQETKP